MIRADLDTFFESIVSEIANRALFNTAIADHSVFVQSLIAVVYTRSRNRVDKQSFITLNDTLSFPVVPKRVLTARPCANPEYQISVKNGFITLPHTLPVLVISKLRSPALRNTRLRSIIREKPNQTLFRALSHCVLSDLSGLGKKTCRTHWNAGPRGVVCVETRRTHFLARLGWDVSEKAFAEALFHAFVFGAVWKIPGCTDAHTFVRFGVFEEQIGTFV